MDLTFRELLVINQALDVYANQLIKSIKRKGYIEGREKIDLKAIQDLTVKLEPALLAKSS